MKTGSTAAGLLSPGWTQPGAEVSKTVLLKSMLMTDPRKSTFIYFLVNNERQGELYLALKVLSTSGLSPMNSLQACIYKLVHTSVFNVTLSH